MGFDKVVKNTYQRKESQESGAAKVDAHMCKNEIKNEQNKQIDKNKKTWIEPISWQSFVPPFPNQ